MNWLSWERLFTYFYNKFRPVNHIHYIKCGVNSSLHNSGCCIRSVAPWITVLSRHSIHKDGAILQIYFCVIFRQTRHHSQAHITSVALCALSLAARRTHSSAVGFAGQCLLRRLLLRLVVVVVVVVVVFIVVPLRLTILSHTSLQHSLCT